MKLIAAALGALFCGIMIFAGLLTLAFLPLGALAGEVDTGSPATIEFERSTLHDSRSTIDFDRPTTGAATPARAVIGSGLKSPDGTEEVMIDLPRHCRLKNTGGNDAWRDDSGRWHNLSHTPGDGSGLCVFTSVAHEAFLQSVACLRDLQKKMTREEGGGYPDKVDQMLVRYCADIKGHYVQNTNADLAFIRDVLETGRLVGCTYDGTLDPHYQFKHIEHMLNVIHLSEKWAAVLDNNFIADKDIVWMRPDALAWMASSGHKRKIWAVVLSAAAPLPIPKN